MIEELPNRHKSLKIISLGGFGTITQNMFIYETPKEILIVDCGLGFPKEEMLGFDLVIPDTSYLNDKKERIKGIVLTHGHDDHIGGLPYILPKLPKTLPIFGPRWAIALSRSKLEEFGLQANLKEIDETSKINLGVFNLEFIKVTHSIPDAYQLVIRTPVGIFYHGSDFKFDLSPVLGSRTKQDRIQKIGRQGVLCLLSDCIRAENPGFTPPEVRLEEMFEQEISSCPGSFFMTTISSNISRLKQAIDVSLRYGRKIIPVGRSIEKNIELATKLKYLQYSRDIFLTRRQVKDYPPDKLTFLVAGSQGQIGSALDRIVGGETESIKIKKGDKVIFSTDYIPGNETAIYNLIDNIYRLGGEVVYQDIHDNIHVSGHGSQGDLRKLMELVQPKYFLPIGGEFRHMVAYRKLAESKGFKSEQVILADGGQVIEFFADGQLKTSAKIESRQVMVDALGVGDVGNVVLRDRKILAQEGIVTVILPLDQINHTLVGDPEIVTRGFVYIKENLKLLNQAKELIRRLIKETKGRKIDYRLARDKVQKELEKFFFRSTSRRPMVLTVIIEV